MDFRARRTATELGGVGSGSGPAASLVGPPRDPAHAGQVPRGTDGSNLSCSSGESHKTDHHDQASSPGFRLWWGPGRLQLRAYRRRGRATAAALECPPGAYNIVDGNPSPQHLWLTAFARAAGAPAPPRVSEAEALRASGPDAVYYAARLRGARTRKPGGSLSSVRDFGTCDPCPG
jgi:hypothetical protein